jgi:hypothetical protein
MGSKKNKPATTNTTNLPALKIGTRIRCTEDGVEGRIVWANGLMVKIAWTDGEKVTWRRDTLATKPIEILDDDTATISEPSTEQPNSPPEAEQPTVPTVATETIVPEQSSVQVEDPTPEVPPSEPTADAPAPELLPEVTPTTSETTPTQAPAPATLLPAPEAITWNVLNASPESETYLKVIGTVAAVTLGDAQAAAKTLYATPHIVRAPEAAVSDPIATEATAADQSPTPTATQPKPTRKAKKPASAAEGEKKLSALDAAYRVLCEENQPLGTKTMIEMMATRGYWTTSAGKTPEATLYSAILREIDTKGDRSRFVKIGRGQFACKATA